VAFLRAAQDGKQEFLEEQEHAPAKKTSVTLSFFLLLLVK
jgi:hypothetical protein